MSKMNENFKYTKVTQIVNNKEITYEQLVNINMLNQFSEKQKEAFLKLLESNGVHLLSEENFLSDFDVKESEQEIKEREKKKIKDERTLQVEEQFLILYGELRKNQALLKQYFKEIHMLKTVIAKRRVKSKRTPEEIISYAIRDISFSRKRYIRKNGRSCGTAKFPRRKIVHNSVYYFFTEDELIELIQCCREELILGSYHWKLLLLFLHHIAKA